MTSEEQAIIAEVEAAFGGPLTEQQINTAIDQARALGELPQIDGKGSGYRVEPKRKVVKDVFHDAKGRVIRIVEREVLDFNPNHEPAGSEHGGEFASGEGASATAAQDLFEKTNDHRTFIDVTNALSKDDHAAIKDAEEAMSKLVPNDQLYKQGGKYTRERQKLHSQIVRDMFTPEAIAAARPKAGEKPLLILSGGRSASGKTSSIEKEGIKNSGGFYINADEIQERLPGYNGKLAGIFNGEAQDIAIQAERTARRLRLNIIYDATLKSTLPAVDRVKHYIDAGYDVDGYFTHTTPYNSAIRTVQRFRRSGRYVPPAIPFNSRTNEKTFDTIRPMLRRWAIYDNNGKEPKRVAGGHNRRS